MKNTALLIIFLVFASLNIYAQTQKTQNKNVNPLIGKWETPNRPDQKTKVTIDIKPGGKIEYSISIPLSGNFITIGNRLISMFKSPQTGGTVVDTSIIVIIETKQNLKINCNYMANENTLKFNTLENSRHV